MRSIVTFFRWLLQKAATGCVIVLLALAALGLWLYLRDNLGFEQWRQDTLRLVTGERAKIQAALVDVDRRREQRAAQIKSDQDRLHEADKVSDEIKQLSSTWDRYVGDRDRAKRNDERLAAVAQLRAQLAAQIAREEDEFTHLTWERDGLQIALGKLDVQIHQVQAKRSVVAHYVDQAWHAEVGRGLLRLPVRTWVLILLALYFAGPTVGKLVLYFGLAPLIASGRAVRLAQAEAPMPEVQTGGAALDVVVRPGERLWVRERFLQSSDEGLARSTRFVLDWRIPLTCLAAGLIELVEMANRSAEPFDQRVTLSNQANPHSELALLTVPGGGSIVLRPSFVAGVITSAATPLRIRRRWQLWRWQAWVTLQFRFFEFVGPARLVLAGSRGVRVENLADGAPGATPARRTNQDATMGFTPNLQYRPVRAETFWSYYRGANPLFDDLFVGRGIFLCQQVATDGDAKRARKFWSAIWTGLMKLFGL